MSFLTKNPRNLLIATAGFLVVVLGILLVSNATREAAVVSTGTTGTETDPATPTVDESAAWFATRPGAVQLGPDNDGIYADCDVPNDSNDPLLVVAYNSSPETLDSTIQVQLTDSNGAKAWGQADFTALRGGETRYVVSFMDFAAFRCHAVQSPNRRGQQSARRSQRPNLGFALTQG